MRERTKKSYRNKEAVNSMATEENKKNYPPQIKSISDILQQENSSDSVECITNVELLVLLGFVYLTYMSQIGIINNFFGVFSNKYKESC